ncbi:heparinase II/III-family protein [Bacteroides salyersiae]|nr:heparinase II/III-family protein [Bacteroides salyersiae]
MCGGCIPCWSDYQPGHAHADTFTFELHINNRPVIIDTGTSTYEVNEARFYERSTIPIIRWWWIMLIPVKFGQATGWGNVLM